MDCPRCTYEIPAEARYCPACGLDLELVSEESEALDQGEEALRAAEQATGEEDLAAAFGADYSGEEDLAGKNRSFWPAFLRIQATRNAKRPYLAATLAFFFGPFAYLYLEQANWFWWGLLGGFFFIFMSRAEAVPILLIGYMMHAYDVAKILNAEREESGAADFDFDAMDPLETEGI